MYRSLLNGFTLAAVLGIAVTAGPSYAQSDLRDPDPAALAERSGTLGDRRSPQSYPTLEVSSSGALDGADPADTLEEVKRDPDAQAIFTALAAQNCRIRASEVGAVLGPLGFDPETVNDILTVMIVQGAASSDARGVVSFPASVCPPDTPAQSPRDRVIAAFRANDCTLSEADLRDSDGVSDLSEAQLLAILSPMRDRGEIETGTLSATLAPDICQED